MKDLQVRIPNVSAETAAALKTWVQRNVDQSLWGEALLIGGFRFGWSDPEGRLTAERMGPDNWMVELAANPSAVEADRTWGEPTLILLKAFEVDLKQSWGQALRENFIVVDPPTFRSGVINPFPEALPIPRPAPSYQKFAEALTAVTAALTEWEHGQPPERDVLFPANKRLKEAHQVFLANCAIVEFDQASAEAIAEIIVETGISEPEAVIRAALEYYHRACTS